MSRGKVDACVWSPLSIVYSMGWKIRGAGSKAGPSFGQLSRSLGFLSGFIGNHRRELPGPLYRRRTIFLVRETSPATNRQK